jgi:hypothetical protein
MLLKKAVRNKAETLVFGEGIKESVEALVMLLPSDCLCIEETKSDKKILMTS